MCEATNITGALDVIEKLKDADGYSFWKFQIEVFFEAADLLDIVETEPKVVQLQSLEWKKKHAKVKRIIVSNLEKQSLIYIVTCKNRYDMWNKLENIYERDSQHQKCTLMQEFFEYKRESDSDTSTLITELKNLAFKLKGLDEEINDTIIISKILTTCQKITNFLLAYGSQHLR